MFYSLLTSTNGIDGLNLWDSISKGNTATRRTEALLNIDNIWGSSGLIVGDYKIVKGTNYNGTWDDWYGPAGDRSSNSYNVTWVKTCPAGSAVKKLGILPSKDKIL